MNLEQYSDEAFKLAFYPDHGTGAKGLPYVALNLTAETGELVMATNFDGKSDIPKELGDILWYVNAAAIELGASLVELLASDTEMCLVSGDAHVAMLLLATRFSGHVGKMLHDSNGKLTDERHSLLLMLLAFIAEHLRWAIESLGYSVGELAERNLKKLRMPMRRKALGGNSGAAETRGI